MPEFGPVVLLPGIFRRSVSLEPLVRALRAAGFPVLALDYPATSRSLEACADHLHEPVAAFDRGHPGPLHWVTHSMGALVVRVYLARHPPERPGRIVMLAPPNQGSELADRLAGFALYRRLFGPAGAQLTTARAPALPVPDAPTLVIAGTRSLYPLASRLIPGPDDGRVGLARTRLTPDGPWLAVPASHPLIMRHPAAIAATVRFLREGAVAP